MYKVWHKFLPNFSRTSRFTLGTKIDNLFIKTIEFIFIANRLSKEQKLPFLQKANSTLDLLKFFLQIAWEIKALDNKKYIIISEHLNEIGRMLGGWQKGIAQKKTPTR